MRMHLVLTLLMATSGFAARPAPDIPVTTTLADFDPTGAPYYVHSDGGGAYANGVDSVHSVLLANGYNHILYGDWRLDASNSTVRTIGLTFDAGNAVQPGDPGYQAPANPPYWGTGYLPARLGNKCTQENHDMLSMKAGDSFPCETFIWFAAGAETYRLFMGKSWYSETDYAQVSCNSADSGGCKDWSIDPIPVVNPDGTASPGRARARLERLGVRNQVINEGDFYLNFHVHVTRP
jgi:hypothetical protein